jgi:hypothetical protein
MATITGQGGASGAVTGTVVETPATGVFGTAITQDHDGLHIYATFVYDNGNVIHFTQDLPPAQEVRLALLVEAFVNPARLKHGGNGPIAAEDLAAVICAIAYAQMAGQPGPTVPVTAVLHGYDIPVTIPTR